MNKMQFLKLTLLALCATILTAQVVPNPVNPNPITQNPVTFDRLVAADREPQNWLTYSGNFAAHQHSSLNQINAATVGRLQPRWMYQMRTTHKGESTPLVVDGIMYLTRSPNDVIALDAATGRKLWQFDYKLPLKVIVCCGQVNRGLAILGDRLFVSTVDAYVLALDARSGRLLWKTRMANYLEGYGSTSAPIVARDKIIVGMAGGEYGARGFIDAYDTATGKLAWRFYTTAGPGDPNAASWSGDSWKTGGATTWVTGAYDPDLNLVYWGTGNPGPDYNGDVRKGDNLYSDSVVALDVRTGERKWHFQFTPHDVLDYDATETPVLFDAEYRGRQRKLLMHANRNAFFYLLDRETGEFLLARPFAKQTWAKEIDAKGRPVRNPGTTPTEAGVAVWPAATGGTNWFAPSFSPQSKLLYVAARDEGEIFYTATSPYRPGDYFLGGEHKPVRGEFPTGAIRAISPLTGEIVWDHKLLTPPWAGVLSTAGGLVFGGTNEGNFFALDAATGKDLWHFQTGDKIIANPISFGVEGKQYISIISGDVLIVFGLPE